MGPDGNASIGSKHRSEDRLPNQGNTHLEVKLPTANLFLTRSIPPYSAISEAGGEFGLSSRGRVDQLAYRLIDCGLPEI